VSRSASANIGIPAADRAHHAGLAPAARFLILCATLSAMTVAGCARHTDQQTAETTLAKPESACRSEQALLEPQPAPDCEFRGSALKTVDPAAFAHLKLDYERQCYRRAEKLARDRLRLLQDLKLCETKQARYSALATQ
jgi:hypothetical protein